MFSMMTSSTQCADGRAGNSGKNVRTAEQVIQARMSSAWPVSSQKLPNVKEIRLISCIGHLLLGHPHIICRRQSHPHPNQIYYEHQLRRTSCWNNIANQHYSLKQADQIKNKNVSNAISKTRYIQKYITKCPTKTYPCNIFNR